MSGRCPSELALEAFLLDPERSRLADHVAACARCAARVERMEREGDEFRRVVFPRTVDAVAAAAAPRRWWRAPWLLPVPAALVGAAAVVLLVRPAGPPDDYVGTKGRAGAGALALTVFVGDAHGARAVGDGESVPAAARLRFAVRASHECALWVVSADAAGEVSRIYPAEGAVGAAVAGGGPLPGGAELDGRAGPERIFALCTPQPVGFDAVQAAVAKAAAGGARSVREAREVPGLPDGTIQSSVLIEKAP